MRSCPSTALLSSRLARRLYLNSAATCSNSNVTVEPSIEAKTDKPIPKPKRPNATPETAYKYENSNLQNFRQNSVFLRIFEKKSIFFIFQTPLLRK